MTINPLQAAGGLTTSKDNVVFVERRRSHGGSGSVEVVRQSRMPRRPLRSRTTFYPELLSFLITMWMLDAIWANLSLGRCSQAIEGRFLVASQAINPITD